MLYDIAEKVVMKMQNKQLTLALAESCTGGLVSQSITSVSGSSLIFKGGVVSYSNELKENILGVEHENIVNNGAVSKTVAIAMAKGIMEKANSNIAGSVTGVAGPTGGTKEKPVGTVYIAVVTKTTEVYRKLNLHGDRREIREQSAKHLMTLIKETIDKIVVNEL